MVAFAMVETAVLMVMEMSGGDNENGFVTHHIVLQNVKHFNVKKNNMMGKFQK